jgi:hypothetical protein
VPFADTRQTILHALNRRFIAAPSGVHRDAVAAGQRFQVTLWRRGKSGPKTEQPDVFPQPADTASLTSSAGVALFESPAGITPSSGSGD